MPSFKIKVVTSSIKYIDQEADYLRVRTTEGELGILANHSPLVAELDMGKMEIEYNDKKNRDAYFISGGFLEISNNEVTIIADDVVKISDIDIQLEEKEIKEIENLLKVENNDKEVLNRKLKEKRLKIDLKEKKK